MKGWGGGEGGVEGDNGIPASTASTTSIKRMLELWLLHENLPVFIVVWPRLVIILTWLVNIYCASYSAAIAHWLIRLKVGS